MADTVHERGALEPCPLCGDPMHLYSGDLIAHLHDGDCLLAVQAWQATERNIALWNHRAALANLAPEAGEAVAWMFERASSFNAFSGEYGNWKSPEISFHKPTDDRGTRNLTPLYAHPTQPPTDAEAMREACSDVVGSCIGIGVSPTNYLTREAADFLKEKIAALPITKGEG